jgi:4-alpha-glucanotransferase
MRTSKSFARISQDGGAILITPDVFELRDQFKLPGMRVLQFAFDNGESNHFLPHNYVANTVAYTGTHDNDTTLGWWSTASEREKNFAKQHLDSDGEAINWVMMRALSKSVADRVIFPMQDVLDLSSEGRMNFPGHPTGNWEWRFSWDQLQSEQTVALAEMSAENGRGGV